MKTFTVQAGETDSSRYTVEVTPEGVTLEGPKGGMYVALPTAGNPNAYRPINTSGPLTYRGNRMILVTSGNTPRLICERDYSTQMRRYGKVID